MIKLLAHLFFPAILLALILSGITGRGNIYGALGMSFAFAFLVFIAGMRGIAIDAICFVIPVIAITLIAITSF